jgi:hypothetical protein
MADLNALIAQGAQFQALPDPFVQYGRMQQLEQGQQANQLNRMKMEEAQAAAVERNALRGLDPTSPEYENQLFKVNPQIGIAYRKERTTAEAQQATQKAQQAQALKTNLDNYRSFLVGVNDQPAYDAWRGAVTKNIPELANMLPAAFSSDAKNLLLQTADDISKRLNAPPPAPEKAPALPPMVAEFNFAKTPEGGNFKGDYQQFVTARAAAGRAPAAPRPEPAPRTQQVTLDDGSLGIVNMDTGVITRSTVGGAPVKGKLSAVAEKSKLQKTQLVKELDQSIAELTEVTKDGGLIDQSTGSGAGRLYDVGAGFFGQAPEGAIAIGKLQPIADIALKMVPRFEGPQSNADTTSYKQAAGQLSDPTLPTKIRKEAGKTVLRLMKARKDQFTTVDMAPSTAPAAIGVDASNPLLK